MAKERIESDDKDSVVGGGRSRRFLPARPERGRFERAIKDFDIPQEALERLSKEEARVFGLLTSVVSRVESLFALQESPDERAKFYPHGIRREEVEKQAESKPELLSPYTVVEIAPDGELRARSMLDEYRPEIQKRQLVRTLREAANIAGRGKRKDEKLRDYLKAKARWLETGDLEDFKASDRIWLQRDTQPTIGFVFGLYDSYLDKFLGRKFSWWASAGLLDREATRNAQWFLDVYTKALEGKHNITLPNQKVRVDHTRLYAGLAPRMDWSAVSMFCEAELRKIGSLHVIFEPKYLEKFFHEKLPAFREFIDQNKVRGMTDGFILTAGLRLYIAHESGHSITEAIPMDADLESRLQDEKDWIEEEFCELSALTTYREIPYVSRSESELAMAMSLIDGYQDYVRRPRREVYYKAYTHVPTYLIRNGVLRIEDGAFTWDDTQEVFDSLQEQYKEVENIFLYGKSRDAQAYHLRNFNPEIYNYLLTKQSYPDTFIES